MAPMPPRAPNCLMAALALAVLLGVGMDSADCLPITSRPIEGNVQRMVWEDWVSLDPEQQSLVKEKKVTAKSIFALPFRHCPQGHTLYNQRCIPQSEIDPTDLVKQELILAGATDGQPPPPPIADYDYGDDSESGEIVYDLSVVPSAMQDALPPPPGSEDQALPSEDAPLKFNIFEKRFPTGTGAGEQEDPPLPADLEAVANATGPSVAPPASTAATTSTTTSTTAPPAEAYRRTAGGDLQASPSDALSTTTLLTMPGSNSNSNSSNTSNSSNISSSNSSNSSNSNNSITNNISNGNFGEVEAIVLPAGQLQESSVQLVTGSLDSDNDNVSDNDNDDSSASANHRLSNAEADLAQLLKVDAFLPAYDGSIELLPPLFSHRKVAPPLSADQDAKAKVVNQEQEELEEPVGDLGELEEDEEETTTDMEEGFTTDPTTAAAATTTTSDGDTTVAEASVDTSPDASTSTSTSISISISSERSPHLQPDEQPHPHPHPPEEPEIDERENRLVLIKSKVQPVQLTTTTTTTAATATTATTTATRGTTAIATTTSAADDADSSSSTDRFHYQHFFEDAAASSTTTATPEPSSSSSSSNNNSSSSKSEAIEQNDLPASDNDNLMTNTIGGHGDEDVDVDVDGNGNGNGNGGETTAQQELRLINELVKGNRRKQQEKQEQPKLASMETVSSEEATPETRSSWSQVMPQLGRTPSEEATTTSTETAAALEKVDESSPATAATTAAAAAAATSAATIASTTATEAEHLSITNRSNRNSKIIRVDQLAEEEPAALSAATSSSSSNTNSNSNPDGYTPFWWLPSIGWRLDRQADGRGGDQSLLLRFFSTFRGSDSSSSPAVSSR